MMQSRYLSQLWFIMVVTSMGCAPVHRGHVASVKTNQGNFVTTGAKRGDEVIVLSADERESASSKYFGVVDITIENRGATWITLDDIQVKLKGKHQNEGVRLVVGSDLAAWLEGQGNREALDNYNRTLALTALGVAGGVAAAASGSSSVKLAGKTLAGVGLGGIALSQLGKDFTSATRATLLPPTHLLAGEIRVPPGMFVRRWIVFYTEKPRHIPFVDTLNINLKKNGKDSREYRVKFRDVAKSNSRWQQAWIVPAKNALQRKRLRR